ncbi:MAG: DUF2530 domain-containing protein [Intrasporangium sp.]|uniref:DUF2530 domain-containing protein n=1 Tax=Intrasporangium sp. TaxID=1925024 RepID=UPI00264971E8|nr:DUF2530 domain-containing protein [Intrasporangium sp.]MDN5798070.1 DUF2530 domain-containing protein [Intrasporangium sp.]
MATDETRTSGAGAPDDDVVTPVHVRMTRIVEMGMLGWLVALVVVLLVPALHAGDRSWWPWCCVAGLGLGVVSLFYVRRGRGNAADA